VYVYLVKYEWDQAKREWTLQERGLDFEYVAKIDWDAALTISDVRQPYPEERFITYAMIGGRLCVAVWCYRGTATRVISLRKANNREVKHHEQTQNPPTQTQH
jgi:uncharacterized DUF497 family protein